MKSALRTLTLAGSLALCALGAQTASANFLYLTSLDSGNGHFARYDTVADSWQRMTDVDTGAQMAVGADGELYAWRRFGQIQRYDAGSDTWTDFQLAPFGANNQYGNLEITRDGRFFYTETQSSTLHYTNDAGIWLSQSLDFAANAVGDYDPLSNRLVVGEFSTGNFHEIDVDTLAVTDFTNGPQSNGERARFGALIDTDFYYQFSNIAIQTYDLLNPGDPASALAVPANPFFNSAAADRAANQLFVGSLNGSGLQRYDIDSNDFTTLATYTNIGNHASLAFPVAFDVRVPAPATLALFGLGLIGIGRARRR